MDTSTAVEHYSVTKSIIQTSQAHTWDQGMDIPYLGLEWSSAIRFKFAKDFGKKCWFWVESQHVTWKSIYNEEATAPEAIPIRIDKKGFQGIRNFIAHVRIWQIQTREDDRLEFLLRFYILGHNLFNNKIDKHDVRRVYKSNILKIRNLKLLSVLNREIFKHQILPASLVTKDYDPPFSATSLHLRLENLSVGDIDGIKKPQNSEEVRKLMLERPFSLSCWWA